MIKLLRLSGMSVESLVAYVELVLAGAATVAARKGILQSERARITAEISQRQETLNLLDQKIAGYEDNLLRFEREKLYKTE